MSLNLPATLITQWTSSFVKRIKPILLTVLAISATFVVTVSLFWNSWLVNRRLSEVRAALRGHDTVRAMTALQQAQRLDPLNGEIHFLIARTHRKQGHLAEFREELRRALQAGFSRERIRREEWFAMAQVGQLREATVHLGELLVAPGDDGAEICEAYANGFFISSRFAEGFVILEAWEKDFPTDPQPHLCRAKFEKSMAEASPIVVEHLKKALDLAPDRHDIRLELAQALMDLRKMAEAEQHFTHLIKSDPENLDVQFGWSQILLENGQPEKSRNILTSILRSQPDKTKALLALGKLEMSDNRHSEAVALLERAARLRGRDPDVRYALATALQRVGREPEARMHFDYVAKATEANSKIRALFKRVAFNSADLELRFEIAELLRDFGDPESRVFWLRSIIELDPQHKRALAALAEHVESLEEPDG